MLNCSRRQMLANTGTGFGLLALTDLMAQAESVASPSVLAPLAARWPHHMAKAKRVIFLYMPGGPSHVDLFDPKPRLATDNGKPLPFAKPKLERTKTGNLLASPWKFSKHGQSGTAVSELLPCLAARIDDICVIRSMRADNINHTGAALQMCTGEQAFSRPSMGSWLTYGLGTENQNLPGFVVVSPAEVFQGAQLWASSFLPSSYQGTLVRDLKNPIANLHTGPDQERGRLRQKLDALRQFNDIHKRDRPNESQLDARIGAFELAFRMQREAPEVFDLSREDLRTRQLYGVDNPATDMFGRQCLMARRLVERGVRFVQLFDAPANNAWDHHGGLRETLPKRCLAVDQPIAALLTDLKSRGLLDETLVLWGGEFGRTPTTENGNGRDHNHFGFTTWLAGGGVKGGMTYGETDDFGFRAVHNRVHIHDLHATILHLLGIDHERLTYRYAGRDFRLTDVAGKVIHDIVS